MTFRHLDSVTEIRRELALLSARSMVVSPTWGRVPRSGPYDEASREIMVRKCYQEKQAGREPFEGAESSKVPHRATVPKALGKGQLRTRLRVVSVRGKGVSCSCLNSRVLPALRVRELSGPPLPEVGPVSKGRCWLLREEGHRQPAGQVKMAKRWRRVQAQREQLLLHSLGSVSPFGRDGLSSLC